MGIALRSMASPTARRPAARGGVGLRAVNAPRPGTGGGTSRASPDAHRLRGTRGPQRLRRRPLPLVVREARHADRPAAGREFLPAGPPDGNPGGLRPAVVEVPRG